MIIAVTSLIKKGEWKEFGFNVSRLEDGLEIVNRFALLSQVLIKVSLIDGCSRIQLPVEVFDGSSLSEPIEELQRQWEQVLAVTNPPDTRIDAEDLHQQAGEACQQRADTPRFARSRVQHLLERANASLTNWYQKTILVNHYKNIID